MHGVLFLAHQIGKSYVLPHVRNSYLTPGAPASTFLFNIGCKGCHVTSSFSTRVTTSETFNFKMADTNVVFFNVNGIKIKRHCIKACKKKNLSCV